MVKRPVRNREENVRLVLRPRPKFYSDVGDLEPNIAKNVSNSLGKELHKDLQ